MTVPSAFPRPSLPYIIWYVCNQVSLSYFFYEKILSMKQSRPESVTMVFFSKLLLILSTNMAKERSKNYNVFSYLDYETQDVSRKILVQK